MGDRYEVIFVDSALYGVEDHWAVVDLSPTTGSRRIVARAASADAQMIRDALNGA